MSSNMIIIKQHKFGELAHLNFEKLFMMKAEFRQLNRAEIF